MDRQRLTLALLLITRILGVNGRGVTSTQKTGLGMAVGTGVLGAVAPFISSHDGSQDQAKAEANAAPEETGGNGRARTGDDQNGEEDKGFGDDDDLDENGDKQDPVAAPGEVAHASTGQNPLDENGDKQDPVADDQNGEEDEGFGDDDDLDENGDGEDPVANVDGQRRPPPPPKPPSDKEAEGFGDDDDLDENGDEQDPVAVGNGQDPPEGGNGQDLPENQVTSNTESSDNAAVEEAVGKSIADQQAQRQSNLEGEGSPEEDFEIMPDSFPAGITDTFTFVNDA